MYGRISLILQSCLLNTVWDSFKVWYMRIIYAIALWLAIGMTYNGYSQNIQLFAETFDQGGSTFTLNSGSVGTSIGNNQWVINNEYIGAPLYSNTISQDSTVSGTIANAPFSQYLHIHDVVAAQNNSIANANYDPTSPSDRFVELTSGICTKAIYDVKLTFFFLCEGNPNAYGEVYYSVNGGPWTKTGANKYFNQDHWKYEVIQNPAFDNVEDLRFGFRWVNTGVGGQASTSFSIDDIIVVGSYDPVNHPVDITITNVSPNPVCRGSNLIVFFNISDTLCYGTYEYELSGPGGSFSNPTNLGVITFNTYLTSGAVLVGIPSTVVADTCYKIRMNRVSPPPAIFGIESACFEVIDCPNIITTHQPVVTMIGTDSVCIHSVIDVPFNSTGVYNANNVYTAELSDSSGSFANPYIIGSVPDPNAYPGMPPGSVSGLIPVVPPGCNYYIRVVSSSPPAIGSVWGPFCIKECDITTNKMQDIHLCINESNGDSATIDVDINTWNNNAQYYQGNQFSVEVHNSQTFAVVNTGGLGATFDTASTSFTVYAPPLPQLLAMGIVPGMYYIRIIADSSSMPFDLLGSLVRLTIGAPSENPPILIPSDSALCSGDIGNILFLPYNNQSQYEWQFNNNNPFIWPSDPIYIDFTGYAGPFTAKVREINFGCYGPWSDAVTIDILTPPNVNIIGPIRVCVGDTINFHVPFQDETYYQWDAGGGTLADTSNNVASMVWDTAGTYIISITALNQCGLDNGYKEITVYDFPLVDAGNDTTICVGDEITLHTIPGQGFYQWSSGGFTLGLKDSLVVHPDQTTTYHINVNNQGNCRSRDTVTVFVEYPQILEDTLEICPGESVQLDAGPENLDYLWSTGETTRIITVSDTGFYTVTILDPSKICNDEHHFDVNGKECGVWVEVPNAFTPNGDGLNDVLNIFGSGNIVTLEVHIYNRWGEEIYYSDDPSILNDLQQGWDGTYKGEPQVMGSYTFYVRGASLDGQVVQKYGNVTLIR